MPLFGNKNKHHNVATTGAAPASNMAAAAPGQVSANVNLPGPAPFTAGPHKHDFMNRLDPTVDSGAGGMQVLGSSNGFQTSNAHAQGNTAHAPVHNAGRMPVDGGALGSNNPYNVQHSSRAANALDPRVDTAQANANLGGNYTMAGGLPAGGAPPPTNMPEGTYGPHRTRMGNMLDPKVDSDADHRVPRSQAQHTVPRGQAKGQVAGQYPPGVAGPAPTTAGPHKHDFMNKLDPSVNSKPGAIDSGRRY
ncbi:hypothetical protein PT974_07207 [Cladobotryum mycophilum]|uniref:Uncharacterized protein n=1 Tax=Cladobotryum mycophilum TaxID=491253 RepID=A0ABR0SPX3_9HYPO